MSDPVQEQLSACLDNELPEAELDLLLKRAARDAQVGQTLGRYALIGETMRSGRPVKVSPDFASKIAAAVAAEQIPPRRRQLVSPAAARWMKPAGGVAIAASVAAIALVAIQPPAEQGQIATAELTAPATPAVTAEPRASYIVPTNTSSPTFIPATRLTNYVVAHSEYSTPLGRRTVLSGVLAEDDTASISVTADPDAADGFDDPGAQ